MAGGAEGIADAASQADAADIATDGSAAAAADPWAAILEAGATLLQSFAAARSAGGVATAPIAIERDPVTGKASIRLPLPDPAVLQRLAKAFEPWL